MNVFQALAQSRDDYEFDVDELTTLSRRLVGPIAWGCNRRQKLFRAAEILTRRTEHSPQWFVCEEAEVLFPHYQQATTVGSASYGGPFCDVTLAESEGFVWTLGLYDWGYEHSSCAIWDAVEDRYVTQDYADQRMLRCDHCGTYFNPSEDTGCPECGYDGEDEESSSCVHSYSTDVLRILNHPPLNPKTRYFGIELEMLFPDRYSLATDVMVDVEGLSSVCIWKEDGSLQDEGLELVSLPKRLGYWQSDNPVKDLLNHQRFRKWAKSHNTTTCGLHVHVSRSTVPEPVIAKLVYLLNEPNMVHLIGRIARRKPTTTYCSAQKKRWHSDPNFRFDADGRPQKVAFKYARPAPRLNKHQCPQHGRYSPVNLTDNTLEFRIFRGSCVYPTVLASIEFCDAAISYCTQYGPGKMNAEAFRSWLPVGITRKTYPALRDYLEKRGVLVEKAKLQAKPQDKLTVKSESPAPITSEEPEPHRTEYQLWRSCFRPYREVDGEHYWVRTSMCLVELENGDTITALAGETWRSESCDCSLQVLAPEPVDTEASEPVDSGAVDLSQYLAA